MKRRFLSGLHILSLAAAAVLLAPAAHAGSDISILTKSGTLLELLDTQVDQGGFRSPGLLLRTTSPSGFVKSEVIPGTADDDFEIAGDLRYEETTGSVFIVFTKRQGILSRVEFAIARNSNWVTGVLSPNLGFYMAMNPQLTITRQQYLDFGLNQAKVEKTRSILSIVWWEEAYGGRARYAPVFVEDGDLQLDMVRAFDLPGLVNEQDGVENRSYPYSSYTYPAVEADPVSNGGVRVTFANIVTEKTNVVKISFPDDLTAIDMTKMPPGTDRTSHARGHTPVGRMASKTALMQDISTNSPVYVALSANGNPTFYWNQGDEMRYVSGGADSYSKAVRLQLNSNLPKERALRLVREMAARD